jgi:hypothetical protein
MVGIDSFTQSFLGILSFSTTKPLLPDGRSGNFLYDPEAGFGGFQISTVEAFH